MREATFGSIIIMTNGYNKDIYSSYFDPDDLPTDHAHPKNKYPPDFLKRIHKAKVDISTLPKDIREINKRRTKLTEEKIDEIHRMLEGRQESIDNQWTSYPDQGFFHDFNIACKYAGKQMRIGLSDHVLHSEVEVTAKGTYIHKSDGVEFELCPIISIKGVNRDIGLEIKIESDNYEGIYCHILNNHCELMNTTDMYDLENFIPIKTPSPKMLTMEGNGAYAYFIGFDKKFKGFELRGNIIEFEEFFDTLVEEVSMFYKKNARYIEKSISK